MRLILFVLSVVAFWGGVSMLMAAKGAIHEIEGLVLILIGSVFLTGVAVIGAVNGVGKRLVDK